LAAAFDAEYAFTIDTWKLLESKAQVTVTISGIFFAAAFGYAREVASLTLTGRILLALTVVTLLLSLGSAVRSLIVSQVSTPPFGTFQEPIVRDLLALRDSELTEETLNGVAADQARQWREAITAADRVNALKSKHVIRSQVLLGIAMIVATLLTIIRIS